MGHWKLLFPRDYVGACDLEGKDKTVTIEGVSVEDLKCDRGTERKPIVRFKGATKKLVLNKTNAKVIAALYGTKTEDWTGKAIALFPTTCSGKGGETVECIRVRPTAPAPARKGRVQPPHDTDTGEVYDDGRVRPEDEPPLPGDAE